MNEAELNQLIEDDHAHVWHPFTPMRQWRQREPMVIERAEGDWLIDARGRRYLDAVSSIWCNVHGHRAEAIDRAIRDQLDRVAHTTMLGLANIPATRLAARLCALAPGNLNKVFYSDAGATAVEVAFKMAIGYHHHAGQSQRDTFVAIRGAYHGDTTGCMSVGYSDLFHRPFRSMVFHTHFVDAPDTTHSAAWRHRVAGGASDQRVWSLEDAAICDAVRDQAIGSLRGTLESLGNRVAAIVIEPLIQGAAGMVMQPPGYLKAVAELAKAHQTLLIADEVAVGFGRTGRMFACEHEDVAPDLLCLGKGISGGYLPLAATLCTDEIENAFTGEIDEHKTLYHGHTYTGNPLACAAALASLDLFKQNDLLRRVNEKAQLLAEELDPLRDVARFPNVLDVRQRGLMIGIELNDPEAPRTGYDPSKRLGHQVCDAARADGVFVRPIGNVVVIVPPLAMSEDHLRHVARVIVKRIGEL